MEWSVRDARFHAEHAYLISRFRFTRNTRTIGASRTKRVAFLSSIFFIQRGGSVRLSSLSLSFPSTIRRHLALLAYSLLPPSPTSYRRYVGCATSLPGNRYLAWLYTEWSSLYRCSPYTNFLRASPLFLSLTHSFTHSLLSSVSAVTHTRVNDSSPLNCSARFKE